MAEKSTSRTSRSFRSNFCVKVFEKPDTTRNPHKDYAAYFAKKCYNELLECVSLLTRVNIVNSLDWAHFGGFTEA